MSEPQPTPRKWSLRPLVAAAVLVPLVPILVALFIGGGGGSAAGLTNAVTVPAPRFAPAPAESAPTHAPPPPPPPPPPAKDAGLRLPSGRGAVVALLRHPTALRAKPGGRVVAKLAKKTQFGSPQAMWVVRH